MPKKKSGMSNRDKALYNRGVPSRQHKGLKLRRSLNDKHVSCVGYRIDPTKMHLTLRTMMASMRKVKSSGKVSELLGVHAPPIHMHVLVRLKPAAAHNQNLVSVAPVRLKQSPLLILEIAKWQEFPHTRFTAGQQ